MQPEAAQHIRADLLIQILCRVGKRRKNQHLAVVLVQRLALLFGKGLQQRLQLAVMPGRDVRHHTKQKLQRFKIGLQIALPCQIIHIFQCDFYLAPHREQVAFHIVGIKIRRPGQVLQLNDFVWVVGVDRVQRGGNHIPDALQGQPERMHRAFQSLEQVDTHQAADTLLTPCLRQTVFALMVQVGVFFQPAGQNIIGRCVDA